MARYGLRIRGEHRQIQIDDRFANLMLTHTERFDFTWSDRYRYGELTPYASVHVPDKPHVIAVHAITHNTTYLAQPTTRRGTDNAYIYYVRPTDNIDCACRVFVFTGFDARAQAAYGLHIPGQSGPGFISDRPYMRVAGFHQMSADQDSAVFDLPSSNRLYAAAFTAFSCETHTKVVPLPGSEGNTTIHASYCRGADTDHNNRRLRVESDVVALIGQGNDLDTGRFEPTGVLVIDVTDLY